MFIKYKIDIKLSIFFDIIIIGSDNMKEELIKKLNENINCDLSIEEIKLLYGIDYEYDGDFMGYQRDRDNHFNDLSKIFDKKYITEDINDINENTICFFGDLTIDDNIPTYNLKYVYGEIYIDYKYSNLDNLEKVYGDISIYNADNNLDRLSNLNRQKVLLLYEELDDLGDIYDIKYTENGELINLQETDYDYVLNTIKYDNISSDLFLNLPKSFYTKELIIEFLKCFYGNYELLDIREMENAFKVVPKELLDNDILVTILERNGDNIKYLPKELITKELLVEFLSDASYEQIERIIKYIPSEYYNDILRVDRVVEVTTYFNLDKDNITYRRYYKLVPLNILLYEQLYNISDVNYILPKDIYEIFKKEKVEKIYETFIYNNHEKKIISTEKEEVDATEEIYDKIPDEFKVNVKK